MAKYKNSVFGCISGSIGDEVGISSTNKKIIRSKGYSIKTSTVNQELSRDVFKNVLRFSKLIQDPIIRKYWKGVNIKLTAKQNFLGKNIESMNGIYNINKIKLTFGSYEPIHRIIDAQYVFDYHYLRIDWDTQTFSNGKADDILLVIFFDNYGLAETPPNNNTNVVFHDTYNRGDGTFTFQTTKLISPVTGDVFLSFLENKNTKKYNISNSYYFPVWCS